MGVIIGKGNERYCYAVINSTRSIRGEGLNGVREREREREIMIGVSKLIPILGLSEDSQGDPFEGRFSVYGGIKID